MVTEELARLDESATILTIGVYGVVASAGAASRLRKLIGIAPSQ